MNNENKPKVTIIKKNPAKEQKEQEKNTVSSQPKVTVSREYSRLSR